MTVAAEVLSVNRESVVPADALAVISGLETEWVDVVGEPRERRRTFYLRTLGGTTPFEGRNVLKNANCAYKVIGPKSR